MGQPLRHAVPCQPARLQALLVQLRGHVERPLLLHLLCVGAVDQQQLLRRLLRLHPVPALLRQRQVPLLPRANARTSRRQTVRARRRGERGTQAPGAAAEGTHVELGGGGQVDQRLVGATQLVVGLHLPCQVPRQAGDLMALFQKVDARLRVPVVLKIARQRAVAVEDRPCLSCAARPIVTGARRVICGKT